MRVLHTADWHVGKEWHGVDRIPDLRDHVIPEIVDIALQEGVGLVAIAGDILDGFGRESLNLCAMLLRRPMKHLLDSGVHVALIPGNHDSQPLFRLLSAALDINPLSESAKLLVFTKPDLCYIEGVQVIGMPYLTAHHFRHWLVAERIRYPVDPDLQNQTLSLQYEAVLRAIKQTKLNSREPALLIGHFAVSGSRLQPEQGDMEEGYAGYETSYARDLAISREALLTSDQTPQYNALGHMHRGQSVLEAAAPTHYAGAPERFERGEETYQPRVLLVDLPQSGHADVEAYPLGQVTPFIREEVSNVSELRALADRLGQESSRRVLGDLVIKVNDVKDYPSIRDEAYDLFPRLRQANTVRPEMPESAAPVKFETTSDYTQVSNPRAVFDEYFSGFSEEEVSHLEKALDTILTELDHES